MDGGRAHPATESHVLMIAFHFPPFSGSSGSQRTLAFARYLPRNAWLPVVLTVQEHAYDRIERQDLRQIPSGVPVRRAFALDAARHLAICGRYPGWLAVPDRWNSWQPFAYRAGLKLVKEHRPRIIWSTYPIASAHVIGARLQARTGIPWIADMRDPMVEVDPHTGTEYPRDPAVRAARLRIEGEVAARAAHVVFCTEAAREIFVHRFGEHVRSRASVIPNGYDEDAFREAERAQPEKPAPSNEFRLIHSGTVYPKDPDRGPSALFTAMDMLRARGELPKGFRLVLRATGHDAEINDAVARTRVDGLVELAPPLPYREALTEMLSADGLLLLQGSASNPAVPAKLYEYLRARRPILALVHPEGETAALLQKLHGACIAPLDDAERICVALKTFLDACRTGQAPLATSEAVAGFSRAAHAGTLAALLSRVARERGGRA